MRYDSHHHLLGGATLHTRKKCAHLPRKCNEGDQGRKAMCTYRMLRIAIILSCIGVTVGLGHLGAQPAEASAGPICVAAQDVPAWCAKISGSGGHVNYILATGNKYHGWARICNYRADVRISGNGNPRYAFYSNSSGNGCAWGAAQNQVQINRTFPKGFYVCTSYYIKNQQQGREICFKLT